MPGLITVGHIRNETNCLPEFESIIGKKCMPGLITVGHIRNETNCLPKYLSPC